MSVTCAPRDRMAVNASWPGRVDEGDATVAAIDLVRADGLRDATGFARDDVRVPDRVEQRRLAVVDVTHDRDHRRARLEQRFVFFVVVADEQREQLDLLFAAGLDEQHLRAERLRDQLDHLVGERRGRGDHLARLEQEAHEVGGRAVQLGRELLDRDAARHDDLAFGDRRVGRRESLRRRFELVAVATPLLAPPRGRTTGPAATGEATAGRRTATGTTARATAAATGTHRYRAPPGRRRSRRPRAAATTTGTTAATARAAEAAAAAATTRATARTADAGSPPRGDAPIGPRGGGGGTRAPGGGGTGLPLCETGRGGVGRLRGVRRPGAADAAAGRSVWRRTFADRRRARGVGAGRGRGRRGGGRTLGLGRARPAVALDRTTRCALRTTAGRSGSGSGAGAGSDSGPARARAPARAPRRPVPGRARAAVRAPARARVPARRRFRPRLSASRRTRSAEGSSMLDEWLLTPILSSFESSTTTWLSTPSSRASS